MPLKKISASEERIAERKPGHLLHLGKGGIAIVSHSGFEAEKTRQGVLLKAVAPVVTRIFHCNNAEELNALKNRIDAIELKRGTFLAAVKGNAADYGGAGKPLGGDVWSSTKGSDLVSEKVQEHFGEKVPPLTGTKIKNFVAIALIKNRKQSLKE